MCPTLQMEQEDVHAFNGEERKQFSLGVWIRVEVVGLSILIVIVWGLLKLPTIFFHIPVSLNRS